MNLISGLLERQVVFNSFTLLWKKVDEAADKDEKYNVVHLDFSNAFDRVPHIRLLSKGKAYGIQSWLKDKQ